MTGFHSEGAEILLLLLSCNNQVQDFFLFYAKIPSFLTSSPPPFSR